MQDFNKLQSIIEDFWSKNLPVNQEVTEAVNKILDLLDKGLIKVAEKINDIWVVNQWIKKAILLSFKIKTNKMMKKAPAFLDESNYWYDKLPAKFANWQEKDFIEAQIRAVPGSYVRFSAYIGKNVILMPSFVNVGAYVNDGSMIDSWATIGSCAQIGRNCHISGGVGIGGVLEPLQSNPVIIEDNCFIGARSEIAEGMIIEEGAVIGMGVFLSSSTKIYDRMTGEISYGKIPAYSVVVSGTLPDSNNVNLYAAIIVKKVDSKTRNKTSINELLRS